MKKNKKIIFNNPVTVGNEIRNIRELNYFSSNGKYSIKCINWLKKNLKCKEALLVNSCTAALEMSAILLNIKPKDEIIMPSFTFVSTANAFVLRGGQPVFVDIDPKTLNIDPNQITKAITKKTKAIVVVHYAGISCDMDPIIKIAKKYKLLIIEDAAQAILSKYNGKPLGSIGDLASLSFHETKNIHCGEGGALLINNPKFINRAKILANKGTNRELFNRNLVNKYSWVDIGSSYSLNEINAAFLFEQFLKSKKIINHRKKIFNLYNQKLKSLKDKGYIKTPHVPQYSNHNGHLFYIEVLKKKREDLIKFMKKKSIMTVFHYIPLHSSKFGKKNVRKKFQMQNTNNASRRILRLPMHKNIEVNQIRKITKTMSDFFEVRN
tara:strand:- start:4237 stop:5376 length:1140 start_codon:yes stop_codon:yes gene_type:complete